MSPRNLPRIPNRLKLHPHELADGITAFAGAAPSPDTDEVVGKNWTRSGGVLNCEQCPEREEKFSSAFKAKVAIDAIKVHRTISELAQEFEIHPNQVSQWKQEFLERNAQV